MPAIKTEAPVIRPDLLCALSSPRRKAPIPAAECTHQKFMYKYAVHVMRKTLAGFGHARIMVQDSAAASTSAGQPLSRSIGSSATMSP